MDQVLYYPSILIPNEWLKKTILFSDKISSIYPKDTWIINDTEENLSLSNMEFLMSLGLYEKTKPEDLDIFTHREIFKDLAHVLDESLLVAARERYRKTRSSYEIYLSKMNYEVIDFLIDNKLQSMIVIFQIPF